MTFKKLALVTAIACAPAATFAVESLDDTALSATTGQDGIQITLDVDVTTNVIVHDMDGISSSYQASYANAGAIVITGLDVLASGIVVQVDAGDVTGTADATAAAPVLNVNVDLTGGLTLITGTIGVGNSNRDDTGNPWGNTGNTVLIDSATVTIGQTDMNIQLGSEPQGNMVDFSATITSGLTISGFGITDASVGGGTIGGSTMTLIDTGGSNLNVDIGIDITNSGLVIDIQSLGHTVNGMDVRIEDQYLGNSGSIVGDVEIQGLRLAGTAVTISGK